MAGRRCGIGEVPCATQTDGRMEGRRIGMIGGDARRRDARGIGNQIGVIGGTGAGILAQERFAWYVAHARIDRNTEGAAFAKTLDRLQVGETHEDDVAGLEVAKLESEEVVSFALGESRTPALRFGLFEELAGFAALFGFGHDHATIDAHLAAVDRRVSGQRKEEAAIEGLVVVLLEELVDFDIGESGRDIGADAETA